MKRYGVEDLLEAFREAAGPPAWGHGAWRVWNNHVLDCMSRAFGVSFADDAASKLRSILTAMAVLPHPLAHTLEAGLLVSRYRAPLEALGERRSALFGFYKANALREAQKLWGDVGERTEAELRAAGWDPSREPTLAAYIDEI